MNGTSPELLSGWKDIATYLKKGVRTVQRYERDFGLPVRRPAGIARGSVLATKAELDAWVSARPIRSKFRLARGLPKTSGATFSEIQTSLKNMRRLRIEMLELSAELQMSIQTLNRSLLLIGSEGGSRGAKDAVPHRMNAVSGRNKARQKFLPGRQEA